MHLHDAVHGDTGNPLPKASLWFTEGKPNIFYESGRSSGDGDGEMGDDGSDDDLVIEGSKTDYKCPLTLQLLKEPFTSAVCKHSFEKNEIIAMINGSTQFDGIRQLECPQVGCNKVSHTETTTISQLIYHRWSSLAIYTMTRYCVGKSSVT